MRIPCKGCERRCVSPNCHNVETCAEWKAYRESVDKMNNARAESRVLNDDIFAVLGKHKEKALRKIDREKKGK